MNAWIASFSLGLLIPLYSDERRIRHRLRSRPLQLLAAATRSGSMYSVPRQLEAPQDDVRLLAADACAELPLDASDLPLNLEHGPRSPSDAWRALVVLSLAADFLMAPMIRVVDQSGDAVGLLLVLPIVGCTLAQGSLLAAWLVWDDAPFGRRLRRHWIAAGGLCSVWLIGLALAAPPGKFQEIGFTVALTVPVVSLGAQFPLWIARVYFGWRLGRVAAPGDGARADQPSLAIRDLLLATLLVAASFAIARLSPAAQQEREFAILWFMAMSVAATVSAVAILPAAVILLRDRPLQRALAYAGLYALTPVCVLWTGVAAGRWYGVSLPPWFALAAVSLLMLTYAGTVVLAAVAARDRGCRLVWGRR